MPFRTLALTALAGALSAGFVASAAAQSVRTFVSGVGDDANPCSRTAPCRTFAGAISKTAAGGEINTIDAGSFGAVTITKSITIDGGGLNAVISASGTNGIIVNAAGTDTVTLRNLSINGMGTGLNGIRFLSGRSLHLENVSITNFRGAEAHGVDFSPLSAALLSVRNSVFSGNTGVGIFVRPLVGATAGGTLHNVHVADNTIAGLRVEDRSHISVLEGTASGNAGDGFVAVSALDPAKIHLERSVASDNGSAGVRTSGVNAVVRLMSSSIVGNNFGIVAPTGIVLSYGNNANGGNIPGGNGVPTAVAAQQ